MSTPNERPRLSVTVANYNQRQYVGRCLDAILAQSRPPDELIVLDDASTDGSSEVIEPYARRHPWIRFMRNQTNEGMFSALRRMRELVTGDYLYSHSADDYVLPGFFETAMGLAEKYPRAGLIMGELDCSDTKGRRICPLRSSRWKSSGYYGPSSFFQDYMSAESPAHSLGSATIYRWDALREAGDYRPELGPLCDTFAPRAVGLKYGVVYLARPCAVWTMHPDSLSQSAMRNAGGMSGYAEAMVRLMRSGEFAEFFPEEHAVMWKERYERFIRTNHSPAVRFLTRTAFWAARFPVVGPAVPVLAEQIKRRLFR